MLHDKLIGKIKLISKLDINEHDKLFSLMNRYYDNVDQNKFFDDLSDKHHIVLFYDKILSHLRGFTTLKILRPNTSDSHVCLYSGDTIIDKEYWGSTLLPIMWCNYINAIREWYPDKKIYWLLIAKGYKTYRFMPVFFKHFYPHYQIKSSAIKSLLDKYAYAQCGDRYNAVTHLVGDGEIKDCLKPGVADIRPDGINDPHVLFFTQQNPRWMQGTELASILEVSEHNLTLLGKRIFQQSSKHPEFIEPYYQHQR